MSDHSAPPFAQLPSASPSKNQHLPIQYDSAHKPWYQNTEGQSVPAEFQYQFQAAFPPAPTPGGLAPAPQPTYNFPPDSGFPRPISAPAIDPRLVPLPNVGNRELMDPRFLGLVPVQKVGGVRQKSKGKKRQYSSDSDDANSEPAPKKGHPKGSPNFAKDEVDKLLDLAEKHCPLGQTGWKMVGKAHRKWGNRHGRPQRDDKSLEAKFKSLLKGKKPTGSGVRPPEVKRVLQIERNMSERAEVRELSDGGDTGADTLSSGDSDIEVLGKSEVRTAIARRAPAPPPRRNTRINAPELVTTLARTFDPATQRARDEERSELRLQNTQMFNTAQQLRDAQATIESLRSQIMVMQTHTHDVERARDRIEMEIGFLKGSMRPIPPRPVVDLGFHAKPGFPHDSGDESDKENHIPSTSSTFYSSPSPSTPQALMAPIAGLSDAVVGPPAIVAASSDAVAGVM
ncbi:hypothetical protein C8R45DRAFT_923537 [Mycena sanguinolenta]|nr:hypothetical protein C8R45DRAFT_923537 [Mycena sanguinolenta]